MVELTFIDNIFLTRRRLSALLRPKGRVDKHLDGVSSQKEKTRDGRPRGVTIIALLCFLLAAVFVLDGIAIIAGLTHLSGLINEEPGSIIGAAAELGEVGSQGIALLVAAALEVLLGWALWNLQNWARITVIVVSALSIVSFLRGLSVGAVDHLNTIGLIWSTFCFAVNALIVWYLLNGGKRRISWQTSQLRMVRLRRKSA